MGDKSSSSMVTTETKALHPVYSVSNIQHKVRILDGVKVTYTAWVKLFKLHARGYEVLEHIDGTDPPSETSDEYESWRKIDAIVLQWIYGTLSDDLLVRVLEAESTAQQAWNRIQAIFQNNKNSRASNLLHAFTTTTLASCANMNEYFQKLKDIAEQLSDVDQPVTESRLVLQMVSGLPPEYDTMTAFITQSNTTWDEAIDMINREQRRQAARTQTSQSAFVAPRTNNPTPNGSASYPISNPTPTLPPSNHPTPHYDHSEIKIQLSG
ncbi:uncharacterized protein LOC110907242 [Helianthus annuus]|uniref:uncharacterized protein LOC110907242 n=1 Tax=Helianthus annuus TaxID=4232 RepID=UPI000B8EED7B|nr:uncharacterized protein LOC110907242 [Helianthus annuus]